MTEFKDEAERQQYLDEVLAKVEAEQPKSELETIYPSIDRLMKDRAKQPALTNIEDYTDMQSILYPSMRRK